MSSPEIKIYAEKWENNRWIYMGPPKVKGIADLVLKQFPEVDEREVDPAIIHETGWKIWECLFRITEEGQRGYPPDLSKELKTFLEFNDLFNEYTTYSWLTLEELVDSNWKKYIFTKTAKVKNEFSHFFLNPPQKFPYDQFMAWEKDSYWYRLTGKKFIKDIRTQNYIFEKIRDDKNGIRVQWLSSCKEECYDIINIIGKLKKFGSKNKIRIIVSCRY